MKALDFLASSHIWPGPRQTKAGPQTPTVTSNANFVAFNQHLGIITEKIKVI